MYSIFKDLEQIKINYDTTIQLQDGLPFSQKQTIRMIDFYSNSKYLNLQTDELGLDKPFYNIVNAMCDVENAAKDLDTKDISVTSDDPEHYTESFLMSKDIYEWMKEVNFAKTLNEMRDADTRYGSLLVKKVIYTDEDGQKQLKLEIPEWKNVITDQVDIENGAIVEVHWMTPTEMLKMDSWNKTNVKNAIRNVRKQNGNGKRIPVYEVRGEFPRSYIKELDGKKADPEDIDFSYQLYYIAGDYSEQFNQQNNASSTTFTTKLIPLYWEDDTERVYRYKARKKKAGRDFGVGVIEEGEQAQIETNDAVLNQKRAMRYTSKVIGQTASKKLKGRNMMTEVDDGSILEHEDGKPIVPLQLLPAGGLGQYESVIQQWFGQFERATSAYAMQRGEVTTKNFRLQSMALQQSGAVFNDLQEDLGIFITEIFMDWILPYLGKRINTTHILAHEFSMDELREIDKSFATDYANATALNLILSGQIVTSDDYAQFMQIGDDHIKKTKTSRFLQVPKDYYKKMKANITINVTGEQKNKSAVLESLNTLAVTYMNFAKSGISLADDPFLTQIFARLVELSGSGISPIAFMGAVQEQAKRAQEMKQQQGQVPGQPPQQGQQPQPPQPSNIPQPSPMSLQANPTGHA